MILLESNDDFETKIFTSLFEQRKLFVTNIQSSNYFFKLKLYIQNDSLNIIHDEKKFIFNLPTTFEYIYANIHNYLSNINIEFLSFKYNPIIQSISFSKKIIHLGIIHDSIIKNLVLNLEQGFDKHQLYKMIWPNDKDVQLNNDTHMT